MVRVRVCCGWRVCVSLCCGFCAWMNLWKIPSVGSSCVVCACVGNVRVPVWRPWICVYVCVCVCVCVHVCVVCMCVRARTRGEELDLTMQHNGSHHLRPTLVPASPRPTRHVPGVRDAPHPTPGSSPGTRSPGTRGSAPGARSHRKSLPSVKPIQMPLPPETNYFDTLFLAPFHRASVCRSFSRVFFFPLIELQLFYAKVWF